ncbi:MAG: hypothetical protein ACI9BG_000249 [Parasphingorhabdus sp.]|jgi:hypothetical protein|tara:strand:+ start:654 stop:1157 length:504 start_codon:yes stop_codon:yes gene_type:complete
MMVTIKPLITNIMTFMRKVFLLALISIILSALVSVVAAGTAQAQTASTKKALAQLIKDIDLLRPALAAKSEKSQDGYYMIRRGETLDGIIAKVLPSMPLRKSIIRQAIVLANPHAFKRRNPNWMYADKKIKLPDTKDIHRVIFTQPSNGMAKAKNSRQQRRDWVHFP